MTEYLDRAWSALVLIIGTYWLASSAVRAASGDWSGAALCAVSAVAWLCLLVLRRAWRGAGYWRGRSDALNALVEAKARGMTYEEWLVAEIERARRDVRPMTTRRNDQEGGSDPS
jgi:hypothetical protein